MCQTVLHVPIGKYPTSLNLLYIQPEVVMVVTNIRFGLNAAHPNYTETDCLEQKEQTEFQ